MLLPVSFSPGKAGARDRTKWDFRAMHCDEERERKKKKGGREQERDAGQLSQIGLETKDLNMEEVETSLV